MNSHGESYPSSVSDVREMLPRNGPTLLDELEAADTGLRRIYEELARDPDLAPARAKDISELTERRLDLARQVGLAALAARRRAAEAAHIAAPPPSDGNIPSAVNGSADQVESPAAVSDVMVAAPPAAQRADSPPASAGDVAAWTQRIQESGLGNGFKTTPAAGPTWERILGNLMRELGAPRDDDETWEDVEALDLISGSEHIALWPRLPREVQQVWLSMLVARTRAHRERAGGVELQARIKTVISRYPGWAKEYTPGHVNGLQVRHAPTGASWADDARALWHDLEQRLAEEIEHAPHSTRPTKTTKKKTAPPAPDSEPEEAFAASSPMAQTTRGRKTLIIGGDPREPNRVRLERAFAFSSLEWPDAEGPRAVSAIAGRIRGGSYELVIVLQPFVDHSQSEAVIAAAKDAGVRWALAQGYGIPAVKLGLERFLASRTD